MIIATSIAPRGIENQQLAIAGWQTHGFHVVSLNSMDEIGRLQEAFPEVEFVAVKRDAREKYGKPFVFFDDFLAYFRQRDELICGIVNSDVHLIAKCDLPTFFSKQAQDGLVFGSRVDVDSLAQLKGQMYHMGFDFFFFDRKILDLFPAEEFCIGQPWWDYWLPIVPLGKGVCIKRLISPVAFHVKHAVNWDLQVRTYLGLIMARYIRTPEKITEKNMMQFLHFICQIIHKGALEIELS